MANEIHSIKIGQVKYPIYGEGLLLSDIEGVYYDSYVQHVLVTDKKTGNAKAGVSYLKIHGNDNTNHPELVMSGDINVKQDLYVNGTITGNLIGNATSATSAGKATKLATKRSLWGNDFDGTANVDGAITIKNGANLTLQSPSDAQTDPGDIVFTGFGGDELCRLYKDPHDSKMLMRFGETGTSYTMLHSGNSYINNENRTVTINNQSITLPTDTNTWRPVQCNGTSIGENTLNLKSGSNITLSRSGGTITINATMPSIDGGEMNVQSDWNETDINSDAYIKNKPTIPTNTSQLTNNNQTFIGRTDGIMSNTDADNFTDSGAYLFQTGNGENNTNFPITGYGILNVFNSPYNNRTTNYIGQLLLGSHSIFYRTKVDTWSDWKQIALTSDIPTKLSQLTDDVVAGKYLKSTIYGDCDADTLFNDGFHSGHMPHLPSGSSYGIVHTLSYRGGSNNTKPDFASQIFTPCGDDSTSPNDMFFRTSLKDSWNGWNKVITDKNIGNYKAGDSDKLGGIEASKYFKGDSTNLVSNINADNLLNNACYLNATGNGSGNENFPHTYSIFNVFTNGSDSRVAQVSISNDGLATRSKIDSWGEWRHYIHSGNIGSQSVNYATWAGTTNKCIGAYTSNGGEQYPSYVENSTIKWNMMRNTTTYYDKQLYDGYCDWMLMDSYGGSNVPYVTGIGVLKGDATRAFIMSGAKGTNNKWKIKELATKDAVVTTDTNQSIGGNKTFTGKVTVNNDFIAAGKESSHVYVDDGSNQLGMYIHTDAGGGSYTQLYTYIDGDGTDLTVGYDEVTINTSLRVFEDVHAYSFYQNSDERLKTFGDKFEVDFEKLAKLRKSYFTFNNTPDKTHIGVSAQEVQKICPEIVNTDKDGYLSVDYSKLSVVALTAVDELYKKNIELENRLAKIEAMLAKINIE